MSNLHPPTLSYFVCASHRSGSSLLCEALSKTGLAGRPAEYFSPTHEQQWRRPGTAYAACLADLVTGDAATNGVFGAKVMLDDFVRLKRMLKRSRLRSELAQRKLLSRAFSNTRFIWLTRRNKVRQAVSFHRAVQTGVWAQWKGASFKPLQEPTFNYQKVHCYLMDIIRQEAGWQTFYSSASITPYTIVYEDFVADYEDVVARVLKFLGIPFSSTFVVTGPYLQKQADSLSEEWVQAYYRSSFRCVR